MTEAGPICRARLLSDLSGQTACEEPATSVDGRLCAFHSRQCQGLYRGYKRRNTALDAQAKEQPLYLKSSKSSIAVLDFQDVSEESVLRELHDYLFKRYNLLDRVIQARRLHHSHFFAIDNDYGHEKYLDRLQNERFVMAKALERLGRRGAKVMYEEKKWFDWVEQAQVDEETQRESESKKVKLESLLFKRHQKEVERHRREIKAREDKKREEEFLDEVYVQRLAELSVEGEEEEEEEEDDEWDPVHDVYGYERDNYIDLIRFFLMLKDQENTEEPAVMPAATGEPTTTDEPKKVLSKSAKKRARKANTEMKRLADPSAQTVEGKGSGVIEMETRAQMRKRLSTPVKFERPRGMYIAASEENKSAFPQTAPIPENELEKVLDEVAEIKNFLFCRLLLSQATLLPIALEANSIDEFFASDRVTREHLRDLCIKLERPGLQDVRDACADFLRGENEDENLPDIDDVEEEDQDSDDSQKQDPKKPNKYLVKQRYKIPKKYKTKRERSKKKEQQPRSAPTKDSLGLDDGDGPIDFGNITDESRESRKRTRIKICGRYMYNYPSEKSLQRAGWFHFSIIAKDSELFDAIELCRNWNEFFELNILCMYHYFPAPKWTMFTGDLLRQQLLQIGFIPYFHSDHAESVTHYFQSSSRGMSRRAHQVMEMRNFICGHIKRNDPVSRRFIQYLSMETWRCRILVRDPKTGQVLIKPPDKELWILREKSGWGRAAKKEFDVLKEVGTQFFEEMDQFRQWHFSFDGYYDVYIWDSAPGRPFSLLQRKIEETMSRSLRVHEVTDMFSVSAPILKTLYRDPDTGNVRSIRPKEKVPSIFDDLKEAVRTWKWDPEDGVQDERIGSAEVEETYKYTEADEIEDAILFPLEATGEMKNNLFKHVPNAMEMFEKRPVINWTRFALDLDTDDSEPGSDGDDDFDEDNEIPDYTVHDFPGGKDYGKPGAQSDAITKLGGDDVENDDENAFGSAVEDDGDSAWDTEDTESLVDQEDLLEAVEIFSQTFKTSDYFLPVLKDPSKHHNIPVSIRESPIDLMGAMRLAMRNQKTYGRTHASIEEDFFRHIDREKSKLFKNCWHLGDHEPGALGRYLEWGIIVEQMDSFVMQKLDPRPFELCKFMDMAYDFTTERRIVDDAFRAYASIALFFETEEYQKSKHCQIFSRSLIFDQKERAKKIPDRRTHMSNKTMPKQCWAEWDKLMKDNHRVMMDEMDDLYPMEWRCAIRPIVMRLFRAGVISTSYLDHAAGLVTAYAEPGRPLDLYIDYRAGIPSMRAVGVLKDPTPLDRSYILNRARAFRDQHPKARFAALRLWSAPHFYPLMLGLEKREITSFLDDRGRCWEFKFIPKDMPFSEWSVQQQLSLRLEPHRRKFGDKVFVARDLILVMGKDADELRKLAAGATWAVQTRPWRLEIDFWRSFVNVDLEFLEGLHPKWLE